jgi:hypothetical protein
MNMENTGMVENLKGAFRRAGLLAFVGLLVGVGAGWWGMLRADGAEAVAGESAPLSLTLLLLLPIALILAALLDLYTEERRFYTQLPATLIRLLIMGGVGSVAGVLLFMLAAYQIPAIFGGEDPNILVETLRSSVLGNLIPILIVTIITAVPVAIWANRHTNSHQP